MAIPPLHQQPARCRDHTVEVPVANSRPTPPRPPPPAGRATTTDETGEHAPAPAESSTKPVTGK